MATDLDRLRQTVESILRENKALNERDVKAAVGKLLKMKPAQIGAGVIREVRRKLGIDRPAALAWARAYLAKAPDDRGAHRDRRGGREVRHPGRAARRDPPPSEGSPAPAEERAEEGRTPEGPAARGRRARRRRRGAGRPRRMPEPVVVPGPVKGEVSVTFQGRGNPEDLARFFLSLSKQR